MLIFASHLLTERYFSWRDKPMMPNAFMYLLLPGYRVGLYVTIDPVFQFVVAAVVDCILFATTVWVVSVLFRYLRVASRSRA